MRQRLASLLLLLVLFGGAFAAVPLSFGDNHCGMGGGMNMSCCKTALLQKLRPKLSEAELLCAIECAQSSNTLPVSVVRVTAPAKTAQPTTPPRIELSATPLRFVRAMTQAHSPPGSPPKYLRNLALLI